MVNQRVFPIGGAGGTEDESGEGLKQILNVQFRKTYSKFLHLLLHQNFTDFSQKNIEINMTPKLRL